MLVNLFNLSIGIRRNSTDAQVNTALLCPERREPNPMLQAPKTLVTFDVDGTLIRSVGDDANKFHKDAFAFGGVVKYVCALVPLRSRRSLP